MARISTYTSDNTITKSDKLLGSNADGTTKNFTIEDITSYLKNIGVSGKYTAMFHDHTYGGSGAQQTGTFIIPGNTSQTVAFSTITTLRISKFPFGSTDSALQRINRLEKEHIIIANVDDINQFGVYQVTAISQEGSTNFYNLTLAAPFGQTTLSNGNLEDELKYSFEVYSSNKRYTHNQSLDSTTWTINHNLGKFPSVSIKFSSSDQVYSNVGAFAGVVYTDENNLTINLAAAESGYAYLN